MPTTSSANSSAYFRSDAVRAWTEMESFWPFTLNGASCTASSKAGLAGRVLSAPNATVATAASAAPATNHDLSVGPITEMEQGGGVSPWEGGHVPRRNANVGEC